LTWLNMLSLLRNKRKVILHEEWPLGKLFLPSVITDGSPVQCMAGLACPSGKHRQKKSGRGLPRLNSTKGQNK
jgi:hypothetical protein